MFSANGPGIESSIKPAKHNKSSTNCDISPVVSPPCTVHRGRTAALLVWCLQPFHALSQSSSADVHVPAPFCAQQKRVIMRNK